MVFFFFKQKTAYEMRISDWSSDVCSSDLNFAADGYDQGKGYGRNLTTGRDIHKQSYYSLRGKILWQPSGGTNVLLTASHNFAAGDTGLNTATLPGTVRSEEHTSELQSLMRISYAVFCLKKKKKKQNEYTQHISHKQKQNNQSETKKV